MKLKNKKLAEKVKHAADVMLPVLGYTAIGYLAVKAQKYGKIAFEYGSATNNCVIFEDSSGGYGRAVKAITNSNMGSWYKESILMCLKKGMNDSYYEAVIDIVNSNMGSWYKESAILNLR